MDKILILRAAYFVYKKEALMGKKEYIMGDFMKDWKTRRSSLHDAIQKGGSKVCPMRR